MIYNRGKWFPPTSTRSPIFIGGGVFFTPVPHPSTIQRPTKSATRIGLIITKDISGKNKIKHDINKTANSNQNPYNDIERVTKKATNVENQLTEIRKSLHQQYQNGQWKPNNCNQSGCKVEDKSKGRKNTALIVGN